MANKCEVQLAYAIGVAEPVSIGVNCFGTNRIGEAQMVKFIKENFDLTPSGIIEILDLKRPIYRKNVCLRTFWTK